MSNYRSAALEKARERLKFLESNPRYNERRDSELNKREDATDRLVSKAVMPDEENDKYFQTFGKGSKGGDFTSTNETGVDNTTTLNLGNDNTFGAGSNLGNNNAITFINQGEGENPFTSLQRATQANALNNNMLERSKQNISGAGRAEQAIQSAEDQTGSRKIVENLYNSVGADQKYWQDSAELYRARAFGDRNLVKTPVWRAPKPPKDDD